MSGIVVLRSNISASSCVDLSARSPYGFDFHSPLLGGQGRPRLSASISQFLVRSLISCANNYWRVVALLGACFVSACAHNVLYDDNRDKQAQEAKKAVADAKVAGAIAALEKTFTELAAREEDRARDRATHLFDLEIRIISRAPSLKSVSEEPGGVDGLLSTLRARLAQLGLKEATEDNLKQLRTLGVQMVARTRALEVDLAEFRGTVGHRFGSCSEIYAASVDPKQETPVPSERFLAGVPAERRALVPGKLEGLIKNCRRIEQVLESRSKLLDEKGEIKSLVERLDMLEREIVAYDVERAKAREELDNAVKAFRESGVEAATKPGTSKLQSLEQRVTSLQHVVKGLRAGGSAFGLAGAHVVAEAELKHLEAVLAAVAGSPGEGKATLNADDQVAVAIVRDLPALADEADKLLTGASKPRLVPFLAAIDQQKIVLQGYEAGHRAKRKQADAVRNQLQTALSEVLALARVQHPLERNASWAGQSIGDLNKTLSGREKREFYRALATYADEVQQHRIEAAVWRARARAAQYEEGLVRSKFAAAQWDSLLDMMATVLADYHAAGIKRADLAEFFKALGLVAIGIGVAQ